VCSGWLKLREETIELLRVRKKIVTVYERLVAKGKTPGYIPGMADVEAKKAVPAPAVVAPTPTEKATPVTEIKKEIEAAPAPAPSTMKRKAHEPARAGRSTQRHKRR
jgi:hypothetical protein